MKRSAPLTTPIRDQKIILGLSLPLIFLLLICSMVGLLYPDIYKSATPKWIAQTVVQDGVDLFLIVPVLTVAALYSFQGIRLALLMWGGTVTYVVYTFLIYCFSVHFNVLFLAYCLVLGLAVFSLLWFTVTQLRAPMVSKPVSRGVARITGIYFIAISVGFYMLWLADVIPAVLSNQVPNEVIEAGLMTNPVQAIDLSVFLPLIFVAGIISIRANPLVVILIPVLLIFLVLMDITICALTIVMGQNGLGGSPVVALASGILAVLSMVLLIVFVSSNSDELSN
jgi:hypothetical protein